MTLICDNCGSHDLRITNQSYGETTAYEGYQCGGCGGKGALTYDEIGGQTLSGCVGSDGL